METSDAAARAEREEARLWDLVCIEAAWRTWVARNREAPPREVPEEPADMTNWSIDSEELRVVSLEVYGNAAAGDCTPPPRPREG
jgi:hypothetical protein